MSVKKGGSKYRTINNKHNTNFLYPSGIKSVMNKNFIESLYGKSYRTSGGSRNKNWFSQKFIPNTVKNYMKHKNSKKTVLGMMKEWNTHNKKNKISKIYCNKMLREIKKKNRVMGGGRIVMPKQWFTSKQIKKNKTFKKQRGGTKFINHGSGDSIISGANIPENSYRLPSLQGSNNFLKGETSIFKESGADPVNDNSLQLNCTNNNCNELINSPDLPKDPVILTNGFSIYNNTPDNILTTPSNLWKNSEFYSTKNFSSYELPQPRAGKRKTKNKRRVKKKTVRKK